ncbi:HAD family hydrolase [soil metagenome]|nr:HAD family hydrolase [Gemmatimonadota bacterium]
MIANRTRRPGVFLDRDGTVIHDRHYLADPAGVELLPGAGAAIARLNDEGVPVILVTNQSGIGRGYFSDAQFHAVQQRLKELLRVSGARLDAVYYCPHTPDAQPACVCRKPAPGMFLRAAEEHALDLSRCFYIGDRARDISAADHLQGTPILLQTRGSETVDAARLPSGTRVAHAWEDVMALVLERLGAD